VEQTPNLGLRKPEGTDVVDIDDLNYNADVLDVEVTKLATASQAGRMSAADKAKLDGIAAGAEVNQNAFSNVKVGATTIAADSKTDTLELAAGSGISLTPDATNDKVTIGVAFDDTVHGNRGGGNLHATATQTTAGFMSAADKSKLDSTTSAATPNTIVQRDSAGRFKAAAPAAADDVARKAEVDAALVAAQAAQTKADAALPKSGGTMTGSLFIDGGALYRSFAVRREVSGVTYTSDLSVSASGEAQVVRFVDGSVNGAFRIEGTGRYNFDNTKLYIGAGAPEGVIVAPVGSLYLRTDGGTSTTLYVKTSGTGNTGWTAK
jgi:hypothetical protein